MKTHNPLFIIGDIHGDLTQLRNAITFLPDNASIICVGDVGLGFNFNFNREDKLLEKIDKTLKLKNSQLILMRGNHDNPALWDESKPEMEVLYDNIQFVNDVAYLHYSNNGVNYKIIMVGGAISVDRTIRMEGRNYWKKEVVNPDALKKVKILVNNFGKADILLTHSAPTQAPQLTNLNVPILAHYSANDKTLLDELIAERQLLQDCLETSGAKRNIHGHFHESTDQTIDGVRFTCLNEFEVKEIL